jgi:adenylate kinase family enzyme
VRRILVTGITGAGKTTLARAVAGRLGIGFHEMDALALCGPGWQENPRLLEDVDAISAEPGWVFDSLGYPQVRDLLWTRADGIVWLDYPRRVVMSRVLRRSAARTLRQQRVFGGERGDGQVLVHAGPSGVVGLDPVRGPAGGDRGAV